jgi:hypothetical protein
VVPKFLPIRGKDEQIRLNLKNFNVKPKPKPKPKSLHII